jgi:multidrug efflux pump subunit AcrB
LRWCRERKKLYQLSGISKVELLGVQDERVWLELDTRKLAAVGVQVNSLIKDLQGQNVILWQPMAAVMMSGLAVASLLTLLFVPAGCFLLFWFDKDLPPAS